MEVVTTIFAIVAISAVAKNVVLPEGTKIYFDFFLADNARNNAPWSVRNSLGYKLVKREVNKSTWLPNDAPVSQISFLELVKPLDGWEDVSANDRLVYAVEKKLEGPSKNDPNHPDFKSGA